MIGAAADRRRRRGFAAAGWLSRGLIACCVAAFAALPAAVRAQTGMPDIAFGSGVATDPDAQMLLEADELVYDFDRELVSARGNVRVFYNGYQVEAAQITYHRASGRLIASGGVRIVEPGGNVITAREADITDDFAEGFIQSLNVETAERTRFAAQSAERREGEVTIFRRGIYTACEPCEDDPTRPPLWQVKASRIIHNQVEKTVTYHNARLEFFGLPVAYFPWFQHPDPTVKRKSGFLTPSFKQKENIGYGVTVPFFWVTGPNHDITLRPTYYTEQGLLNQVEWRHRLVHGAYSIKLAGILQQDPDVFDARTPRQQELNPRKFPGEHEFRGIAATRGQFELSPLWSFGWDLFTTSDRTFGRDYDIDRDIVVPSTVYLTGMSERNFFDASGYHFTVQRTNTSERDFQTLEALRLVQRHGNNITLAREAALADAGFVDGVDSRGRPRTGLQLARQALVDAPETVPPALRDLLQLQTITHDLQNEQAWVHPVVDHAYIFDQPIFGGQLRIDSNLTSLSRDDSDLHVLPAVDYFSGVAGNFTRTSTRVSWRRSLIGLGGQEFTPFAYLNGDAYWVDPSDPRAGLEEDFAARAMPAVGLEYRWPFIATSSWAVQTFSPVAQVILRPNEQHIGELPNEDALSLVFDDTILFDWDKFSGWDRQEGGGRANLGFTYLASLANGVSVDAVFGQSFHLFGTNSFAVGDVAQVGPDTGLETDRSDYVGGVNVNFGPMLSLSARGRFDEDDFQVNRSEISATARHGRSNVRVGYALLGENETLGVLDEREEIMANGKLALTQNWSAVGRYVYDIDQSAMVRQAVGLAYDDECFNLSILYAESNNRYTDIVTNRTVSVRVNLRTLGGTNYTQNVDTLLEESDETGARIGRIAF